MQLLLFWHCIWTSHDEFNSKQGLWSTTQGTESRQSCYESLQYLWLTSFALFLHLFWKVMALQMLQKLIQRIFKMRTAVSRLSNDVAKLGGASDTLDFRKRMQDSTNTIKVDAESIKDDILKVAPEQKNRQTAKVISDFEVSPWSTDFALCTSTTTTANLLSKYIWCTGYVLVLHYLNSQYAFWIAKNIIAFK